MLQKSEKPILSSEGHELIFEYKLYNLMVGFEYQLFNLVVGLDPPVSINILIDTNTLKC